MIFCTLLAVDVAEIVRVWRPVLKDRVNANPRWGREDKQEKETL